MKLSHQQPLICTSVGSSCGSPNSSYAQACAVLVWRSLDQAQGSKCWRCVPVLSECTSGDLVVCGLCRECPLLLVRPMFLLWALVCVCHILLYLLFDGFLKVINCLCWLWFVCSVGGVKWCWWCVLLARCEVDLSRCGSL